MTDVKAAESCRRLRTGRTNAPERKKPQTGRSKMAQGGNKERKTVTKNNKMTIIKINITEN